jgi:hypothetical protein
VRWDGGWGGDKVVSGRKRLLLYAHFFIFPNGFAEFLLNVADADARVSGRVYMMEQICA